MNRARILARSIGCESNLRQISLALSLYVNDFEVHPLYADASTQAGAHQIRIWDKTLLPYCGRNSKLFQCPAWKPADIWNGGPPTGPTPEYSVNGFNFCYGYNAFGTRPPPLEAGLGLGGINYPNTCPVPAATVREPSDMIAIGDYRGLMTYQANGLLNPWSYVDNQSNEYLRSRHPQGAKVTFCDAHVESLGRKKRWPLKEADVEYSRRWNNDNQPHRETWP
jgi:prepilin-type processing-associated H-X9-DG protein